MICMLKILTLNSSGIMGFSFDLFFKIIVNISIIISALTKGLGESIEIFIVNTPNKLRRNTSMLRVEKNMKS